MKSFVSRPRLVFATLLLALAWVFGRNALAGKGAEELALPNSCTLLAMSPAERAVHLKRLEMLRRSASAVKMSADGFTFAVDLGVMSPADLQGWAANEQKCCSYLKIESRIVEEDKRATVHVVCPADLRNETMQSFGLRAHA